LIRPTEGTVLYDGKSLGALTKEALLEYRKKMQIIFQDPYASLNPRLTIEQALTEPMVVHQIGKDRSNRRDMVVHLLEEVGLTSKHLLRYPHEFSGGQRQRICVARALAVEPEFIVCDECVSAMDVSVQAQVLNLLRELQKKRQLTYLFISHDLSVVKFISDKVVVMHAGKIVESGTAQEVYANPREDYTKDLIASIPSPYNLVK
jgi:peptide/nickel transport system ATP-binding protein